MENQNRLSSLVYSDILGRRGNENTAKEWAAIATQFEQVCGYKGKYTREDLTLFLGYLRKRELCQNTIYKYLKPLKLLAQIQEWDFPKLPMRRVSFQEVKHPILDKDDVISLIQTGKQLLSPPQLCFLALATTYGLRRVEMVRLEPSDLNAGTITVNTAKEGPKTTHLIPREIAPYLASFQPYKEDSLTHMYHKIMVATGLRASGGFGWHSIRRVLTTELTLAEASTLNVARFMRWSETTVRREFGMQALYSIKDQYRIDEQVFAIHPFLPYWGTGEPRRRMPKNLQPLIDLIGELDEEEVEQLITLLKRKEESIAEQDCPEYHCEGAFNTN